MVVISNRRRFRRARKRANLMGSIRPRRRRRPMTTGRVKRIIDAELKVRDVGVGPTIIPKITGNVTHVTQINLGDTNVERTGNWIKPTSWMATITVEGDDANTSDTSQFRVGCFVWKENQMVDPATLAKIVQDTSAPHQQFKVENKGQFKILWSRTGLVSNNLENS